MIALTLLMTFSAVSASAQNKDRRKSFQSWDNYEITTEKVGVDGTKFVKVWGFGKNVDAATMAAKSMQPLWPQRRTPYTLVSSGASPATPPL